MKREIIYPVVIALCVSALASSAKAIIDVEVLKTDRQYIKEYLVLIYKRLDKIENKIEKEQ